MPNHILLLGAGFSRNWGGWLASEAFEYLLGSPGIAEDDGLRGLLWRHKDRGGFEAALAELQSSYLHTRNKAEKDRLARFQAAVSRMFADMNTAINKIVNFEPRQPPQVGRGIIDFLSRFDVIFTLNQDLLLERHYVPFIRMGPPRNWSGVTFPGLVSANEHDPMNFLANQWKPGPIGSISKSSQPIYKLHGSSNWIDDSGDQLLIMGANKLAAIKSHAILKSYQDIFAQSLATSDAKLMVIGYSFTDGHIDALIRDAASKGLRLFIIDPLGTDVVNKTRDAMIKARDSLEDSIIGASRRSLRETFGSDDIEHAKVLRFFST